MAHAVWPLWLGQVKYASTCRDSTSPCSTFCPTRMAYSGRLPGPAPDPLTIRVDRFHTNFKVATLDWLRWLATHVSTIHTKLELSTYNHHLRKSLWIMWSELDIKTGDFSTQYIEMLFEICFYAHLCVVHDLYINIKYQVSVFKNPAGRSFCISFPGFETGPHFPANYLRNDVFMSRL